MVYSVHICTVGSKVEPSVAVIGSGIPIDKMYLLNSRSKKLYDDCESEIRHILISSGIKDIETIVIDPFDYQNIVDAIFSIESRENRKNRKIKFYINFTSGTNIMAGAACNASYFIDSELYYVMNLNDYPHLTKDEQVRLIQTPKIPDIEKIKGKTREILKKLFDEEKYNKTLQLSMGMQANTFGYHTALLEKYGLIEKRKCGKEIVLSITSSGKMVIKWMFDFPEEQ